MERTISTNGGDLHVVDEGTGPPVILAHGFPETSYSWRHQIPALAEAGYRAVAPDGRGYGRSSRPDAVEDYDIEHLNDDLLGVLDDLGHEKGVFVGHDWGAIAVWALALRAPERVAGVVGMSVPFIPRGEHPPTETMRHVFADNFFYMLYFQEPGVADANLAADVEHTMRGMLLGLTPGAGDDPTAFFAGDDRGFAERLPVVEGEPDWINRAEIDRYVETFEETGFTGGLNWYRNLDRNWELMAPHAGAKVQPPAAFVGGVDDPVLMMTPLSTMDGWLTDPRGVTVVEGAGHWVQQEKPAETNAALLAFLRGLDPW